MSRSVGSDVGLVLDSSAAASGVWGQVQQFARALVRGLDPKPGGNNVGVVNFGDTAQAPLAFNALTGDDLSASSVNAIIDGIQPTGLYTMINSGIRSADQDLFSSGAGMRADARKVKTWRPISVQITYRAPVHIMSRCVSCSHMSITSVCFKTLVCSNRL